VEALQLILGATGQIPGAKNEIREAKSDNTATVRAGQVFGIVQAKRRGEVDE